MKQNQPEDIPGIGPKIARDLHDLGLHSVKDLKGHNPEDLYARLSTLWGCHIDRCVLYIFRCAVYYAENGHDPDKLTWWNWKDEKRQSIFVSCPRNDSSRGTRPSDILLDSYGLP